MAVYVYGIMRAGEASRAASAVQGVVSAAEAIDHGQVSALVRPLPDAATRMGRENILAHADVLQAAFEHGPVLPLRLGTVVADPDAVARELLAPGAQALASRLEALNGKGEMQVKAIYAEEPLLRSILTKAPALRRAVERSRRLPAAATHFEQIRIGEAIAAAVDARRMADADAMLGVLRPLAVEVSVSAPNHERAALNAAFLVQSDQLGRFDAAVQRLSEERAADLEFKLIGPLPPYSFAGADLRAVGVQTGRATWA